MVVSTTANMAIDIFLIVLYSVHNMIHILSITNLRQNLPQLIKGLVEPLVIVQNSKPSAVLIPYKDFLKWQEDEEQKQFMDMVKTSPSYIDDADEKQNYKQKDLKPLNKYEHTTL